jgi:putative redox protein
MKKLKFTFKNAAGEELAGLLELPENPKAFALLAHFKKIIV